MADFATIAAAATAPPSAAAGANLTGSAKSAAGFDAIFAALFQENANAANPLANLLAMLAAKATGSGAMPTGAALTAASQTTANTPDLPYPAVGAPPDAACTPRIANIDPAVLATLLAAAKGARPLTASSTNQGQENAKPQASEQSTATKSPATPAAPAIDTSGDTKPQSANGVAGDGVQPTTGAVAQTGNTPTDEMNALVALLMAAQGHAAQTTPAQSAATQQNTSQQNTSQPNASQPDPSQQGASIPPGSATTGVPPAANAPSASQKPSAAQPPAMPQTPAPQAGATQATAANEPAPIAPQQSAAPEIDPGAAPAMPQTDASLLTAQTAAAKPGEAQRKNVEKAQTAPGTSVKTKTAQAASSTAPTSNATKTALDALQEAAADSQNTVDQSGQTPDPKSTTEQPKPAAARAPIVSDAIAAFLLKQMEPAQAPTPSARFGQTVATAVSSDGKPAAKPKTPAQPAASAAVPPGTPNQQPEAAPAVRTVQGDEAPAPRSDPAPAAAHAPAPHPAAAQTFAASSTPDAATPLAAGTPAPAAAPPGTASTSAPPVATQIQVGEEHHDSVNTLDKLALTIATKSVDGVRHFDIRLDPPELGRVQVHLSVDDSGRAQASLIVDKPQTLELLQKDAPSLNRALSDAGLDLPNNGLNFSLREQYRQNDDGGVDKGRGRALSAAAVVQTDANQIRSSLSYAPYSARLDIRV